jgi:predicted amino acid-binding ACT domain protein
MPYEISRVEIWAGEVEHYAEDLARRFRVLKEAGASLEFAVVRQCPDMPGNRVLFVAPLEGAEQIAAAERAGLHHSKSICALRIGGPDRPGFLADVTGTLAEAGIAMLGLSAASIRDVCVLYLRLEGETDARRATEVLTSQLK